MKLLTIGGATYDILIQYNEAEILHRHQTGTKQSFLLLEEGKKIEVDGLDYKTGGGATNSAVSFARLGFEVSALFKVGNDFQGKFIKDTLQQEGVAIHLAQTTSELPTSSSCIISCPSGERTLLVYRGASKLLKEQEIPVEVFSTTQGVYITALSGQAMSLLPIMTKLAKQAGNLVAVNPGTNQLKGTASQLCSALSTIDILILNSFEASLLMCSLDLPADNQQPTLINNSPKLLCAPVTYEGKCFNINQFFTTLLRQGPSMIVVTNGAEGVYVATGNEILFHPSLPTNIVSTLGAGDAFGSAFTAAIIEKQKIDDAIRCGILNSSSVLKHYDAKTGLLPKKEMITQLSTIDKRLLQRFTIAE